MAVAAVPAAAIAAAPPEPYSNGFENSRTWARQNRPMFECHPVVTGTEAIPRRQAATTPLAGVGIGRVHPATAATAAPSRPGLHDLRRHLPRHGTSTTGADLRFDWASAINKPAGAIGGTSSSTSAPTARRLRHERQQQRPVAGRTRQSGSIRSRSQQSGWYTFQHHFHDNGSGVLAVDMTVSSSARQRRCYMDAQRPHRTSSAAPSAVIATATWPAMSCRSRSTTSRARASSLLRRRPARRSHEPGIVSRLRSSIPAPTTRDRSR